MTTPNYSLPQLGFSAHFMSQLSLDELEHLQPMRVLEVQRDRLTCLGESRQLVLALTTATPSGDFAVGDWVLVDAQDQFVRSLSPKSSLRRRAAGTDSTVQLIANNVDTLFIVSSCNADFSVARLERYLALSAEAMVTPVVLLTKADLSDQVDELTAKVATLMSHLPVLALDAISDNVSEILAPWCGSGQTIALVGSSGVGKTTLLNALTGEHSTTQDIREADSKGRHTTTHRSMLPMKTGGWVIDTPGMRALRLLDSAEGIDAVFDEIIRAAAACRFSNCAHTNEPGCAVQAAIENGELDAERLQRWRKLQREDERNTQTIAQARQRDKQFVKMVNKTMRAKEQRKGG